MAEDTQSGSMISTLSSVWYGPQLVATSGDSTSIASSYILDRVLSRPRKQSVATQVEVVEEHEVAGGIVPSLTDCGVAFTYPRFLTLLEAKKIWLKKVKGPFPEFKYIVKDPLWCHIYEQCQFKLPNKSEDEWIVMSVVMYIKHMNMVKMKRPRKFKEFCRKRLNVVYSRYREEAPLVRVNHWQ